MAKAAKKKTGTAKKAAKTGTKAAKKKATKKSEAVEPRGLSPAETRADPPAIVTDLCAAIEGDGGVALAPYREPLGGHWVVLAALPLPLVEPTPYQRGLSDTHFKKLAEAISRVDRFLDPVIAIRTDDGRYQTPNGHHRASAMKHLGARALTALVVTEPEVARLILALNVEKAHNLKEKCSEVVKLARELERLGEFTESQLALEFEEPAFLTLGICYEERPRFAGSTYHTILKRADSFHESPLGESLETRAGQATKLLAIDDEVARIVKELKAAGMDSPYLKNFVVAKLNPFRSLKRGAKLPVDDALEATLDAATSFDLAAVSAEDIAKSD